jgi:C1A family cysteine protease
LFTDFIRDYDRSYSHDEFPVRFRIFKENLDRIEAYNDRNTGVTLAMNKFGDLTKEEFRKFHLGYKAPTQKSNRNVVRLPTDNLPKSVNWTLAGAVTPIKNQKDCGSCWSFSTTGSLEGLNFLTNKKLLSFSEQQLVDCSDSYGNEGCDGGLMDDAFQYVMANGIETEDAYPYTAEDGTCVYDKSKVVFTNKNYTDVAENDLDALAAAVAQQPVSVAVEADQDCFQYYSGGVMNNAEDCGTSLDHGVLAVGYGTTQGQDYWIVKNSWGADWGMAGYILLGKSSGKGTGVCGIAMEPSYPVM